MFLTSTLKLPRFRSSNSTQQPPTTACQRPTPRAESEGVPYGTHTGAAAGRLPVRRRPDEGGGAPHMRLRKQPHPGSSVAGEGDRPPPSPCAGSDTHRSRPTPAPSPCPRPPFYRRLATTPDTTANRSARSFRFSQPIGWLLKLSLLIGSTPVMGGNCSGLGRLLRLRLDGALVGSTGTEYASRCDASSARGSDAGSAAQSGQSCGRLQVSAGPGQQPT